MLSSVTLQFKAKILIVFIIEIADLCYHIVNKKRLDQVISDLLRLVCETNDTAQSQLKINDILYLRQCKINTVILHELQLWEIP